MNLKFWEWGSAPIAPIALIAPIKAENPAKTAAYMTGSGGQVYSKSYDGEKNVGEFGPAVNYYLNYNLLRVRSWQSYLESDIAKTVLDKYTLWVVDKGLKLNANPSKVVLKSEGIQLETEKFNELIEARFTTWSKSKKSSFNGMFSFNQLAQDAFKSSRIGGDVLVILRLVKGVLKVELIDGENIQTPYGSSAINAKIKDGIEIGENGEHIAFHVKTALNKFERVLAKSSRSGFTSAFLVYGNRYRLNSNRGIPVISTVLETIKKIERYKEAAVGSAEERAKIVYQIVHQAFSDGSNPLQADITKNLNLDADQDTVSVDAVGNALADTVAISTNKQTINMPLGGELKSLESSQELAFKEFFSTNADLICAAIGIPPNVAFSLYNDSFSASRAATKDWDHTIDVVRDDFQTQFYQRIYDFYLYIEILKNKIQAPGYLTAFSSDNYMVIEAYQSARFTGPMFPHIDPLKEAKAEREKLGSLAKHLPLSTLEQSTEVLGGGDSDSNIEQFAEEIELAKSVGLKGVEKTLPAPIQIDKGKKDNAE